MVVLVVSFASDPLGFLVRHMPRTSLCAQKSLPSDFHHRDIRPNLSGSVLKTRDPAPLRNV
jgi:hypothetical protein